MAVIILLILGVVLVYSASSFKAQESHGDSHHFLKNHLLRVAAGFLLMLLVARTNYRTWLNFAPVLLAAMVVVLIFMLISDNVPVVRGSKRWLMFGSFAFQTSDFARLALILFLSLSLGTTNYITPKSPQSFFFHLGVIACVALPVILQPDIGSALMIIFIALTLLFMAGERVRYLLVLAITSAPFFLLYLLRHGYQKTRLLKFVQALKGESLDWQPLQSFIALGNGHVLGLGLGSSRQKYHFLPDPFTDFIYAILGEELGLIGTTLVLALFLVIVWSGFRIAKKAPDFQGKLLGLGLTINIAVYAAANMGVVVNLLPTTGVPMPFLSYGGSALLVNLFAVGVLLNIADQGKVQQVARPGASYHLRRRVSGARL